MSAYAATQLVALHAAWAGSARPRRNMNMVSFFYTLLPNELAPLAAAVHAATLVVGLRAWARAQARAEPLGWSTVGVVANVAVLVLHVRAARRNVAERAALVDALTAAGVPHAVHKGFSWSDWAQLAVLIPRTLVAGPPVAVHRNVRYWVDPEAVRRARRPRGCAQHYPCPG
jgi:hypothetical protein